MSEECRHTNQNEQSKRGIGMVQLAEGTKAASAPRHHHLMVEEVRVK